MDVTPAQYCMISFYLESQVSQIINAIETLYKPRAMEISGLIMGVLNSLASFPAEHRELRIKLKANNSNPEFVKIFEDNFKEKSIQIIDHLFFFVELFQKNLKETTLESLMHWGKEFQIVMGNINQKFDNEILDLKSHLNDLQKNREEMSQDGELSLSGRSKVIETFEQAQIEMSKGILLTVGESSKSIKFSFEFLEKTLNSLVKVFDALGSHSELTLGDESTTIEGEELDRSISEYFKIEGEFATFLKSKKDSSISSQLLFGSSFDQTRVNSAINELLEPWIYNVAPYLHPISNFHSILHSLESLSNTGNAKGMLMSPEINFLAELSDDDITLASSQKYSARINQNKVPCNGTLMLLSEFLVFFSKSIAGTVNLLIPFKAIQSLKEQKNFIGMNNGFQVSTVNWGPISIYVDNSTERNKLIDKLKVSSESLKASTNSMLYKQSSYSDKYVYRSNSIAELKDVPIEIKNEMIAISLKVIRKLKIRYYDLNDPVFSLIFEDCSLFEVLDMFVSNCQFEFEGKTYHGFQDYAKSQLEMTEFKNLNAFSPSRFTTSEGRESGDECSIFLEDYDPRLVANSYQLEGGETVIEKFNIYYPTLDCILIHVFASTSSNLNEYEAIVLLSQGLENKETQSNNNVQMILFKKQGIKPFKNSEKLYEKSWADLFTKVREAKMQFEKGEESEYKQEESMTSKTPPINSPLL